MNVRDARSLDLHGAGSSAVHRLDPRAKALATAIFIVTVASHGKDQIAALVPFASYSVGLAILGFVPFKLMARRTLAALPFVVLVGVFNPILDRSPGIELLGVSISSGWISFGAIMVKGLLCVSAAVVLTAVTSFPLIIQALRALQVPRALTVQLMLLYRYLFLLIDEAGKIRRARALRGRRRTSLGEAAAMLSTLLISTLDRGEAIWLAMKARGFEGEIKTLDRMRWRMADTGFLAMVGLGCLALRFAPLTRLAGEWGMGS